MPDAFIIDACRTPRGIGKQGKGSLAHLHPANNMAAMSIMSGMDDLVIGGGTEMMSIKHKGMLPIGALNEHLRELHPQSHQGVCADAIATLEGISREDLDAHAAESQRRAAIAIREGRFDTSLIPVKDLDGTVALDREEFPRPGTTVESLSQLAPSFPALADYRHEDNPTFRELINQKYPDLDIQHVHHAGNSSGVVDGAAAILWASEAYAEAHGLTPRARVVACATVGDDPTLMLNAPVPAARKVLERAGMTTDDIDLFEINEAFATVSEKFMRDLDLDRDTVNPNGGAMALGHPIG
ncbi:MAG: acetyl-CoA C-acyltransferase, partial [Acidimicrobiia bacterium]|nr:acetyl-CoA C-acyltransferase [Acidimicrobiia bacterium]